MATLVIGMEVTGAGAGAPRAGAVGILFVVLVLVLASAWRPRWVEHPILTFEDAVLPREQPQRVRLRALISAVPLLLPLLFQPGVG